MRKILLLLAVPGIASAQTTNTNCMVNGQWINCTTQGASQPNVDPNYFINGLGGVRNLPNPYNEQQRATQDRQAAQLRQQQIEIQRLQIERLQQAAVSAPVPEPTETTTDFAYARKMRVAKASDMIAAGHCDQAIAYLRDVEDPQLAKATAALCLNAAVK